MKHRFSKKHLLILCVFMCINSFGQKDSVVCTQCTSELRKELIESLEKKLSDTSLVITICDYGMSYSNSILIQRYIDNEDFEYSGATYSLYFKKKYYQKVYNKLKSSKSQINYIGMWNDTSNLDLKNVIHVMYGLLDKKMVQTKTDEFVYNLLLKLNYSEDYDFNKNEALILLEHIDHFPEQINVFKNMDKVLLICKNELYNTDNKKMEEKIVVKW
ncbi:MAG: hypothetical protein ACO1N0_00770 [Fluviicola sp.]